MKVLITGATGGLGSKVTSQLLEYLPEDNVILSTSNINKYIKNNKNLEVRYADFNNKDSLIDAFNKIDVLVYITTNDTSDIRKVQTKNILAAAKKNKIKKVIYTSISNASNSNLLLAESHKYSENLIINSKIPYVILRNNWYLENEKDKIKELENNNFLTTTLNKGKISWLLKKDYAKAIVSSIINNISNKIFEISGYPHTINDLVIYYNEITNKNASIKYISIDEYRENLVNKNYPEDIINLLVNIEEGINNDELNIKSNDFFHLTDEKPIPLIDALRILLDGEENE